MTATLAKQPCIACGGSAYPTRPASAWSLRETVAPFVMKGWVCRPAPTASATLSSIARTRKEGGPRAQRDGRGIRSSDLETVAFRLDADTLELLRDAARERDCTLGDVIRVALREHLGSSDAGHLTSTMTHKREVLRERVRR